MSRTVAALYDSRSEAELARARLVSELKARSPRILAKDTAAAVDGLKIARADADAYRDGLRRGGHLLVAEVPAGANPKRIIEVLQESAGKVADDREERAWGDGEQGVRVELPTDEAAEAPPETVSSVPPPPVVDEQTETGAQPDRAEEVVEEARIPIVEEDLRVGKREVVRGGARVRSFTRDTPAEEQVALREEVIDVENRPCGRHLSDSDVAAGGLFKERVFDIAEMREEPVVTKVAVVREEVIVRKTVKERTETIRDTVRHTEVEVEDLSLADGGGPTFFARDPQ